MYSPNLEPWENDLPLLLSLQNMMQYKNKVDVVTDDLSPEQLIEVFRRLDGMIGIRLHSTIIATMLGKPSLHLNYSPKGPSYFKLIKNEDFCIPLESLLDEKGVKIFSDKIDNLIENKKDLSMQVLESVHNLKKAYVSVY